MGDPIPYSQFLGCGTSLDVLGLPGDIFVDITRGAYRIFVKHSCWVEWAGCSMALQVNGPAVVFDERGVVDVEAEVGGYEA
jgi:hypothetical protein